MTSPDAAPESSEQRTSDEKTQQGGEPRQAGELETRQEAQERKAEDLEKLESLLSRKSSDLTSDEINLRNELLDTYRTDVKKGIERVEVSQFSGPLPPPGVMADYDRIVPGAAERILQMAEREQDFRHRGDERAHEYLKDELRTSSITQRIGQVAGTCIALGSLLVACFAFSVGASGYGVAIVFAEIAVLSGIFVLSRRDYAKTESTDSQESE
ncbi:DUF2335 domain-containing protein [Halomonas piscis]|uniref:DUF2335 domain-containing protein n=1 Tax=Halomonas piscis TaxID=3031727 RepID=UPI0028965D12|nr:DUF2335 domain-containing protein [Halomonas piscis]